MGRNTKVISSISRKTKLNLLSVIFILFLIISILVSISPIISMISKRNEISSLESKLNEIRRQNIEMLALEKSLYEEEIIKREVVTQFHSADPSSKIVYKVNEIDKLKRDTESLAVSLTEQKAVYSNNNLWENLKILYYKEIDTGN